MTGETDPLKITPRIRKSKLPGERLVVIEWTATNMVPEPITVVGYRLHFQRLIGENWVSQEIPKAFITRPHVVTLLWQDEARNYIWKQVRPSYYGIDQPGEWRFQVQLSFRREMIPKIQMSKWTASNSIRVSIELLKPEREIDLLQKLVGVLPRYLQKKYELDTVPSCIEEPRLGDGLVPDMMCYTEDGWVAIVEVKHRAELGALEVLGKYLSVAERKYARGPRSVVGIIAAREFDGKLEEELSKKDRMRILRLEHIL